MRKKMAKQMMLGIVAACLLGGCGTGTVSVDEKETEEAVEQSLASSGMTVTEIPQRGLIVTLDPELEKEGADLEHYNYNLSGFPIVDIYYYYRPVTEPLWEEALRRSEEDPALMTKEYVEGFYETLYAHSRCLLRVTLIPEKDYQSYLDEGKTLDELAEMNHTEEFARNDGYVYLVSIPEYDLKEAAGEEAAQFESCRLRMEEVKEKIALIPVELERNDTDLGEQLPEFQTKDLEGNEVTNAIFSEKELTVVNVWGTFCMPCIEEMPELGEWAKAMPEDVQLIGLVTDIDGEEDTEHLELAREITAKSGADFLNLIANEDFKRLLDGVVGVPTTFFVDQTGTLVGDPVVGADIDAYRTFVEEYFNE